MHPIFYSFLRILIALFFVLSGIFCLLIVWVPVAQNELIRFILEDSTAILLFGIALMSIGLAIFIFVVLNCRHQYFRLHTGPKAVSIDENAIQNYLNSYWKELFPETPVTSEVALRKNEIYLAVDLPYLPEDQRGEVVEKIKNDLAEVFATIFGYQKPFHLTVAFPTKKI